MLMVVIEAADMSRNRTSKFEAPDSFKCDCCGYETGKSANYHRHLESDRHLRVLNFSTQVNCENNENDFCTDSATQPQAQPTDMIVDGATVDYQSSYDQDNYDEVFEEEEDEAVDDEDEQEYYEERSRDTRTETEWFPFDSKTHFLLTSLYSSKTHRVVSLHSDCISYSSCFLICL